MTGWRPKYTILVSVDTCRADHVGYWGYSRNTTPFLDAFARQGVAFVNTYSQSNESLFSYASLMTGVYASTMGTPNHQSYVLRRDFPALAEWLHSGGVATSAYLGGGMVSSQQGFNQGFEVCSDEWHFGTFFQTMPQALQRLTDATRSSQPCFIWVQGYDAHAPYNKPLPLAYGAAPSERVRPLLSSGMAADFVADGAAYPHDTVLSVIAHTLLDSPRVLDPVETTVQALRVQRSPGQSKAWRRDVLTAEDREALIGAYDGALTYADAWLGLLHARIERLGIADQTLVVIMGDHGEDLLEHGYLGHRSVLAESTLHVPLVFWAPALWHRSVRVEDLVELRALRPTLLQLLGPRTAPGNETTESLWPALRAAQEGHALPPPSAESQVLVAEGVLPHFTLRKGRYRLTTGWGVEHSVPPAPTRVDQLSAFRLYDCQQDPREQHNLLELPAWQTAKGLALVQSLRTKLVEALARGARPVLY